MRVGLRSLAALAVTAAAVATVPAFVVAQERAPQGARGGAPAQGAQGGAAARPAVSPNRPPNPNEAPPAIPGQNTNGMHVYIRAGLKTHGPGFHDYPQFLADWTKILTEHGAVVDGSVHFPTADELRNVDVMVIYKGDTGYMTPAQRKILDDYLKHGGGIVMVHDSMCGPDPATYAEEVGASKRHGETNFSQFAIKYDVVDKANPIMKDFPDGLVVQDEAFYRMTWAKSGVHALATTVIADNPTSQRGGGVGQVVPQIWTYEHTMPGGSSTSRTFAWMQGHDMKNFEKPEFRNLLLRGIAWAGKRPNVEELVAYKPPPRPAGRPDNEADAAIQGR